MAAQDDDRPHPVHPVLPVTRVVCFAIVPFLIVAFGILYPDPDATGRLFAWHIQPTLTSMMLGSAYLGGAYFFLRAAVSTSWPAVKAGFPPVIVFASLMGIATIAHWGKFDHRQVAFWLWVVLYFLTPFLITGLWLSNRRLDSKPAPGDLLLPRGVSWGVVMVGVVALVTGILLFLFPARASDLWPWRLTPLTARVVGAVFCLGCAAIGAAVERRWTCARLPFQVAGLMLVLLVVAGVRAHDEFDSGNPLTWLFAVGFPLVTVAAGVVYWRMERLEGSRAGS